MQCERCEESIPAGEEMDYHGQTLCEVCYMKALSPARACDPWAVRSAQELSKMGADYAQVSPAQERILQALEETGGAEAAIIAEQVEMTLSDFEREFATLRHMEKARGEMRDGVKVVCLW